METAGGETANVSVQTNLGRYRIARVADKPEIVVILIEDAASEGSYGAKGVGEITCIPTASAIGNAIHYACGARVYSLPVTAEKLLAALVAR